MRSHLAVAFTLLGASAWAAPGLERSIFDRAVCNADNCLRAVRASNAKPGPSSATADCSSFFRRTVTPCAATTYVTTTAVITGPPTSITATTVSTEVDVTTFTTTTTTATVTTSAAAIVGTARKRLVDDDAFLVPRQVTSSSTCPATTNAPSSVPVYASACSGTVRYSSACSCAGISAMATTLSQVTVVSTVTATSYTTSTASLTATSTFTSTATNTATLIQSTTTTLAPPAPTSCALQVVGGNKNGQYISLSSSGVFQFITTVDSAAYFSVGDDNSLDVVNTGGRMGYAQPNVASLVIGLTTDQASQPAYSAGRPLSCGFAADTLVCTLTGLSVVFGTSSDNFLRATSGSGSGSSTSPIGLQRVSCR